MSQTKKLHFIECFTDKRKRLQRHAHPVTIICSLSGVGRKIISLTGSNSIQAEVWIHMKYS